MNDLIEKYVLRLEQTTRQGFGVEERIRKLLYEFRSKVIVEDREQNKGGVREDETTN